MKRMILAAVLGVALSGQVLAGELDSYVDLDDGCGPDGLINRFHAFTSPGDFWKKQLRKLDAAIRFNEKWIEDAQQELDKINATAKNEEYQSPEQSQTFQRIRKGTTRLMLRRNRDKQQKLLRCRETVAARIDSPSGE